MLFAKKREIHLAIILDIFSIRKEKIQKFEPLPGNGTTLDRTISQGPENNLKREDGRSRPLCLAAERPTAVLCGLISKM